MLVLSKASRRLRWALWCVYVAVIVTTGMHHESWRDEIDTWIVVQDTNLKEFIAYMSHSGHPPLWFALNLPLARWFGLPMGAQEFISIPFAMVLMWLLLFRSPFPLWLLLPCMLSVHFLFQYAVVARCYPLLLMLLFFVPALHHTRFTHPLRYGGILALLFQTEMHVWTITGMFTLFFIYDCYRQQHEVSAAVNRQRFFAALLPIVSAALALYLVFPRADLNPVYGWHFDTDLHYFADALGSGLIPFNSFFWVLLAWIPIGVLIPLMSIVPPLATILAFIVLTLAFISLRRSRAVWMLAAVLSGFFYILMFVYYGAFWHHGLLWCFLLCICWFAVADGSWPAWVSQRLFYKMLALGLSGASVIGLSAAVYDIRGPYSGGEAVVEFLKDDIARDVPIIVMGCHYSISVAGRLPKGKVWLPDQQRYSRMQYWDYRYQQCMAMPDSVMIERALKQFGEHTRMWFIAPEEIKEAKKYGLVQRTFASGFSENYRVYERVK